MTFDQQQPAFDRRKREILEQIQSSDRSIKQSIDEHALPIVNLLNESTDYVTTSRYTYHDLKFIEMILRYLN
jgi:tRNA(Phe) wybutosine-synthesizing methylase Tyw3